MRSVVVRVMRMCGIGVIGTAVGRMVCSGCGLCVNRCGRMAVALRGPCSLEQERGRGDEHETHRDHPGPCAQYGPHPVSGSSMEGRNCSIPVEAAHSAFAKNRTQDRSATALSGNMSLPAGGRSRTKIRSTLVRHPLCRKANDGAPARLLRLRPCPLLLLGLALHLDRVGEGGGQDAGGHGDEADPGDGGDAGQDAAERRHREDVAIADGG